MTELAFESGATADTARAGILIGSVVAGGLGYLVLRTVLPPADGAGGDRYLTGRPDQHEGKIG